MMWSGACCAMVGTAIIWRLCCWLLSEKKKVKLLMEAWFVGACGCRAKCSRHHNGSIHKCWRFRLLNTHGLNDKGLDETLWVSTSKKRDWKGLKMPASRPNLCWGQCLTWEGLLRSQIWRHAWGTKPVSSDSFVVIGAEVVPNFKLAVETETTWHLWQTQSANLKPSFQCVFLNPIVWCDWEQLRQKNSCLESIWESNSITW